MSAIKAVLLCNTSRGQKGDVVEASADELAKLPHVFRSLVEVEAAKAAAAIPGPDSVAERHRKLKQELIEAEAQFDAIQAKLRKEQAEADLARAAQADERARVQAERAAQTAEIERLRAENARLVAAERDRALAEAKILELRPSPVPVPPVDAPKPSEPPPSEGVPPHKRSRG